ncbi:MAG: gliding motility-associated C-terminal domain-containing protein [Bacteroidota bacterium]
MTQKLAAGFYELDFDYLLPCDTKYYALKIYLGRNRSNLGYFVRQFELPTIQTEQWHNKVVRFQIPPQYHLEFDWITILNTGDPNPGVYGQTGAYIYLDDFHLFETTCTACDPLGPLSINENWHPYFTPDGDGNRDEWCVTNIENATYYRFAVYERWGANHDVYTEVGYDADGFEHLELCWDGRDDNGNPVITNNQYWIYLTVGNCTMGLEQLYDVFLTTDTIANNITENPNYTPPLYGTQIAPTHYRNLYLYGEHSGTHSWYACDTIFVGPYGAPHVPYFRAESTSNLEFHAAYIEVDMDFAEFEPGSDVDFLPGHVSCCAANRTMFTGNPDEESLGLENEFSSMSPNENLTRPESDLSSVSPDFAATIFPNPSGGHSQLQYHLPYAGTIRYTLFDTFGNRIGAEKVRLHPQKGKFEQQLDAHNLADGLYWLKIEFDGQYQVLKWQIQK